MGRGVVLEVRRAGGKVREPQGGREGEGGKGREGREALTADGEEKAECKDGGDERGPGEDWGSRRWGHRVGRNAGVKGWRMGGCRRG